MDVPAGGAARRLRAVGEEGAPALEEIEDAIRACVGEAPNGLAPRALGPEVAHRLGLAPADLPGDRLQIALGLLIAGGRIDEAGGRLVPVRQEERRAG